LSNIKKTKGNDHERKKQLSMKKRGGKPKVVLTRKRKGVQKKWGEEDLGRYTFNR